MAKVKKSSEKQTNSKNLNAAQKLEALENFVMGLQQQINILAEEIDNIANVVKSLARRLNASNKVAEIEEEAVSQIIMDDDLKSLQKRVDELVEKGLIEDAPEGQESTVNTFLIAKEVDAEGKIIAPVIQFAIMSLIPELQEKYVGLKVGDKVQNTHNENFIEITKIYNVIYKNKEVNLEEGQEEAKQIEENTEESQG